jgi:dihydroorotate dehydrogenase electron transfer subunit
LSAYLTDINKRRIVKIEGIKDEGIEVKTFTFKDALCGKAEPGQFIMLWVFGTNEIPVSLSMISPQICEITIRRTGKTTTELFKKSPSDLVGVRGPYGNGFKPVKGNILLVGGGTGLSPLMPLADKLNKLGSNITIITGGRTRDRLIFLDRIAAITSKGKHQAIITTDDGSYGVKGFVTMPLKDQLNKEKFDAIYACGPERMMIEVLRIADEHDVPAQLSLERVMKCGIGICGHCVLDPLGLRVCKDGPVFDSNTLHKIEDLGKFWRDESGKKIIK